MRRCRHYVNINNVMRPMIGHYRQRRASRAVKHGGLAPAVAALEGRGVQERRAGGG